MLSTEVLHNLHGVGWNVFTKSSISVKSEFLQPNGARDGYCISALIVDHMKRHSYDTASNIKWILKRLRMPSMLITCFPSSAQPLVKERSHQQRL